MTKFRVKMTQNGTEQYIDGLLTHDEAEQRLDLEESIHRAAGWKVELGPSSLVMKREGIERVIQLEIDG